MKDSDRKGRVYEREREKKGKKSSIAILVFVDKKKVAKKLFLFSYCS